MNVIEYHNSKNSKHILYCIVDNIMICSDEYTKEIIKNLSDFVISLIYRHGYNVIVGIDEESLLKYACDNNYHHAVVMSTGNEIENGTKFFDAIEFLARTEYFIYGHILDRGDAYYELHHQCYLINISKYSMLDQPEIGQQQLGIQFTALAPNRSDKNIHDDYTPLEIRSGDTLRSYSHRMHGYNIIMEAMDTGFPIYAFDSAIRKNKRYYYPENKQIFYSNLSYAYSKQNYCMTKFVHMSPTEKLNIRRKYDQIITVAHGDWYKDYLNEGGNVIIYDYNPAAIRVHTDDSPHVEMIEIDLLGHSGIKQLFKYPNKDTLINITNIFTYEGTSTFLPYRYRLEREKLMIDSIPKHWDILIGMRAYEPFGSNYNIRSFKRPTWHMNSDWT